MEKVTVAHTADLDPEELAAAHRLVGNVFGEALSEDDWRHALGGMHALVWERGELVGHASVVQRQLLHAGRTFRTGYIEAVAVDRAYRRRGYAGAMMAGLERIVCGGYELGALGASDMALGFYAARGWQLWRGPTSALAPTGIARTAWEDGSIFILPVATELDLDGELTCDWREGDAW